jgi:hypothetical protein
MAILLKGVAPEFEEVEKLDHRVAWETRSQMEDEALEAIQKRTAVIKQQVADSYAFYEVVKIQPFQIRHIPYRDKWTADPVWIRGLRLIDVEIAELREAMFEDMKNDLKSEGVIYK